MGNISIKYSKGSRQYIPHCPVKPFPKCREGKQGTIVTTFKAMPPVKGVTIAESQNLSWWIDCQFLPYQDNMLVTSVSALQLRPGLTPIHLNSQVGGLISVWTVAEENMQCEVIRGTSSKSYPHVSPHPNGKEICYIGCGKVIVLNFNNLKFYSKNKDMRNNNFLFSAMSPNGMFVAAISRISSKFELAVFYADNVAMPVGAVTCHEVCPGFQGTHSYSEQVEFKWSPDSAYLAASSSLGHLFVVKRGDMKIYCNILPGMFPMDSDHRLGTTRTFDFHPSHDHDILALCTQSNKLYVVNAGDKTTLFETEIYSLGKIECLKYNRDGSLLAVGDTELCISLFDGHEGHILYTLNTKSQPVSDMFRNSVQNPTILRLSFSHEGQHLAVSSSDGLVRIWQLQPVMCLKDLCRKVVLRSVPANKVKKLPIPASIVPYLLQ